MGQSPPSTVIEDDQDILIDTDLNSDEENIFGEVNMTPDDEGRKVAKMIFLEGRRIVNGSTNWILISNGDRMKVEKKATGGDFSSSSLEVYRAEYTIAAPAREFFTYLTSDEGYKLLVPETDPDSIEKHTCNFSYKSECQLEHSFMKMPFGVSDRTCLVMNVYDRDTLEWACKSVFHPDYSGSTAHYKDGRTPTDTGHERMFYLSFIKIASDGETGLSKFTMVQFMDLGGNMFESISNMANRSFFTDLNKRLQEKAKEWNVHDKMVKREDG